MAHDANGAPVLPSPAGRVAAKNGVNRLKEKPRVFTRGFLNKHHSFLQSHSDAERNLRSAFLPNRIPATRAHAVNMHAEVFPNLTRQGHPPLFSTAPFFRSIFHIQLVCRVNLAVHNAQQRYSKSLPRLRLCQGCHTRPGSALPTFYDRVGV